MTRNDYLQTLDGAEINSIRYEGVVGVSGDKVIRFGEVIDQLTTTAKAKVLFDELFEQEFGHGPVLV